MPFFALPSCCCSQRFWRIEPCVGEADAWPSALRGEIAQRRAFGCVIADASNLHIFLVCYSDFLEHFWNPGTPSSLESVAVPAPYMFESSDSCRSLCPYMKQASEQRVVCSEPTAARATSVKDPRACELSQHVMEFSNTQNPTRSRSCIEEYPTTCFNRATFNPRILNP